MSRRRAHDLALHGRSGFLNSTQVLVVGLPTMCDQIPMHDWHYRRIASWEHEHVLDKMQRRLNRTPQASRIRRQTAEHPFGTIKAWMGATHFLTKTIPRVSTEMSLHVLAYNMKRAMQILGIAPLMAAMRAWGPFFLPRSLAHAGPRLTTQSRAEKNPESSRPHDLRESDLLRPSKDQMHAI